MHRPAFGALLDKAQLVIDEIYNPDPETKEPHEVMALLHESYQDLQRLIKANKGSQEDQIITLCSRLIGDVANVAVMFQRSKQRTQGVINGSDK